MGGELKIFGLIYVRTARIEEKSKIGRLCRHHIAYLAEKTAAGENGVFLHRVCVINVIAEGRRFGGAIGAGAGDIKPHYVEKEAVNVVIIKHLTGYLLDVLAVGAVKAEIAPVAVGSRLIRCAGVSIYLFSVPGVDRLFRDGIYSLPFGMS
ncbi:MAG: hypothetical protein J6S59_03995, partial [Clostridia bacterium]|nr:hypothetical protein [Clostridia bacterium]